MGQLGAEGAGLLKRELVLEGKTEERLRILEIIDTITHDLKTELAYAIGDGNAVLRQAAFQLAERLNDSQVEPLAKILLLYREDPDPRIREIARTRELSGKLSSPNPPIKEKPVATGPAATPGPHS